MKRQGDRCAAEMMTQHQRYHRNNHADEVSGKFRERGLGSNALHLDFKYKFNDSSLKTRIAASPHFATVQSMLIDWPSVDFKIAGGRQTGAWNLTRREIRDLLVAPCCEGIDHPHKQRRGCTQSKSQMIMHRKGCKWDWSINNVRKSRKGAAEDSFAVVMLMGLWIQGGKKPCNFGMKAPEEAGVRWR